MTRKELMEIERRRDTEVLVGVFSVVLMPSGRKSGSVGYGQIDCVAYFKDDKKDPVRFGGTCDLIKLEGSNFQVDSDIKNKLVRIYNKNTFIVSVEAAVISFTE